MDNVSKLVRKIEVNLCKFCHKESVGKSQFCSINCFNSGTKTKGISGYRSCKNCTKEFPYRNTLLVRSAYSKSIGVIVGAKNQKFCTQKCSLVYRNNTDNPSQSLSARKKISKSAKERGVAHLQTPEARTKQIKTISGSGHWNWQGGKTSQNKMIRNSLRMKSWRRDVFTRDNYKCVWCGATNGFGVSVELNADHIKPFALYPESRFDVSNGRTLCRPCHIKTPTFAGRGNKKSPKLLIDN